MENRISEGTVFLEKDFKKGWNSAAKDLDGLMDFFKDSEECHGTATALANFSHKDIIRKWSINLLLMLIFSAPGQRPQVYTKLQCPTDSELVDMTAQAERIHFFELRTTVEKTNRKTDFPHVLVHQKALSYVAFHQKIVRDLILKRTEVDESGDPSRPLIMHTETGDYLTTSQVTRVLKGFISYHFSELQNITMMSLRSSFGTMMMDAFRAKRLFTEMEENEFLSVIAKVINTSVEQLKTTYIGVDRHDFEEAARELSKVLNMPESSGD